MAGRRGRRRRRRRKDYGKEGGTGRQRGGDEGTLGAVSRHWHKGDDAVDGRHAGVHWLSNGKARSSSLPVKKVEGTQVGVYQNEGVHVHDNIPGIEQNKYILNIIIYFITKTCMYVYSNVMCIIIIDYLIIVY